MDKLLAKQKIQQLIEKYQKLSEREIKSFTEEETKKDFILPLFEALGWGVYDRKEVSAEEAQSGGRVDYGFYLSSRLKFFLEAKSFKADLNSEDFAKQAIRYSWNRGADWAILTDFEGLKVFYAQAPSKYLQDKKYFELSFQNYISDFERLWELSRESFEQNLIDQNAIKAGKMPPRVSVDNQLYKDLNKCREILTEKLGEMNDEVPHDLLEEGVQKILNRLIFIRVAEDREVEDKNLLLSLIRQWETSSRKKTLFESMVDKFRELDEIYNSNLFSPHPLEKWHDYHSYTKQIVEILRGKTGYYEYDFKAMPADVLGKVYENYLGWIARNPLTPDLSGKSGKLFDHESGKELRNKSRAKRKEQGIYYTPTFIVDYIVKNALRPVLDKCKSIDALKKIKVLDPACGSGSFLIRVMDEIVKKYEEFGARPNEYTRLTILLDNIYGVDLDEQAVEIAKLNLLVNSLDCRMKLPDLSDNIKNGNSLISGRDEELRKYFGPSFRSKKPFNWQEEFPEVFKQGGFDVVIGNPPYVDVRKIVSEDKQFFFDNYQCAENRTNTFSIFIEKGINLLNENGLLGFIIPNTILTHSSYRKLRVKILRECSIVRIFNLSGHIFKDATVETVVLIIKKEIGEKNRNENNIFVDFKTDSEKTTEIINQNIFSSNSTYSFCLNTKDSSLKNKLKEKSINLGEIYHGFNGINPGNIRDKVVVDNKIDNKYKKVIDGKHIKRYSIKWGGDWILYDKKILERSRDESIFLKNPKIMLQKIGVSLVAGLDSKQLYALINTTILLNKNSKYDPRFILALLNSKLINYYYNSEFLGVQIKTEYLEILPIYKIDFSKNDEKKKHDGIIILVDKMLSLQKQLQKSQENSNEWQRLKHEIDLTDLKIDEEVYKLYGITEEERKIIDNL